MLVILAESLGRGDFRLAVDVVHLGRVPQQQPVPHGQPPSPARHVLLTILGKESNAFFIRSAYFIICDEQVVNEQWSDVGGIRDIAN